MIARLQVPVQTTVRDRIAAASISFVVPVYNSEQTLEPLLDRIGLSTQALNVPSEAILVNDGSTDRSWAVIVSLSNRHSWIRGINLMRNYGQHNALLCGVRAARHEVIVTMDDDLQHPPEEVPRLLAKLDAYDVVYGRPLRQTHGLARDLASRITKLALQSAIGAEVASNVSAFRAFRSYIRDAFADYRGSYVSLDVLLTWGTRRFTAVEVRHDLRLVGRSNYTFGKLIAHAMNMMTGFSILPLELASLLGFAFTLLGMAMLLFVLGRYLLQGSPVPGFPFLASVIAIFSGAQLFALGIIGEYLARVHSRLMDCPTYSVHSTTD